MAGRRLEVIGTDRNYLDRTVRYFMNNGHPYTPDEIMQMMLQGDTFTVNINGTPTTLRIQHFRDHFTIQQDRIIGLFVRNLPEIESS
jgi:hypothetical protein